MVQRYDALTRTRKKLFELRTDFQVSTINTMSIGITQYGYTPLKIGTLMDFAIGIAHDFYAAPYCIKDSECFDVYDLGDFTICLANSPEGLLIKNFDSVSGESSITKENMQKLTKKFGYLTMNRFDLNVLCNIESKLRDKVNSEWMI